MSGIATAVLNGYRTLTPYLVVRGVERLLDFLNASFAAQVHIRSLDTDGFIVHAAVQLGDSMLEMGDSGGALIDDWGNHSYIATHKQDLTMQEIQQRAAQAPRGN